MKKLILFAATLVVSGSAYAQSSSAACHFEGQDGKQQVRCRAFVSSNVPAASEVPTTFPVNIRVRCTNGFKLEDNYGTAIIRQNRALAVGLQHDALAVVNSEIPPNAARGDEVDAILTISEDGRALELEGECRTTTSAPVPAPDSSL